MASGRRLPVAAVCVLALVSAGCLGFLAGSEPLRFSANETVVSDDALAATEYRAANDRTISRTFNVSVAGQTRRVHTTSHLHVYNRTVPASALADAGAEDANAAATGEATRTRTRTGVEAQFAVLATPGASVAGRTVNPLATMSPETLVRRLLDAGGGTDLTVRGNRTVEALGADRTVSTYLADRGQNATAAVFHVAVIDYRSDVVVVVAGHPAAVDERDRVDRLLAGLEQPTE